MSKNSSKSEKSATTNQAEKIVGLLHRNTGATIAELAKSTSWQGHSIRGFMSGTLKKKRGVVVSSSQEEGKPRRYFIDGAKE